MREATIFIKTVQDQGFQPHAAQMALATISTKLAHQNQQLDTIFYVYRTGANVSGASGGEPQRSRLLLAFPSADGALAFAQRNKLGTTPQLLRMSVPQLLAILVQRSAISSLIFVDEQVDLPQQRQLPPGFRLDRLVLLELIQRG